jgi:aspartyl/asparaginyl beta-hydroxylase (cupin superfamily)
LPASKRSPRLAEALDIAAGRRRQYRQEPTAFSYPGLASVPFFDPAQFDWVAGIEAAAPAIRKELDGLLAAGTEEFRAYVQHQTVAPEANKALLGKKDWSILPLCESGWLTPSVIDQCPATWEAVLKLPLPRISGWGPTVVFSLLKGGAHIAAHNGMFNTRLVCHLPLIVPPGCSFRVGNETREWEEGKLMIFDDTIEHEARNDSDEDRVVLIFDVWRPELSEQERFELTALFSD